MDGQSLYMAGVGNGSCALPTDILDYQRVRSAYFKAA